MRETERWYKYQYKKGEGSWRSQMFLQKKQPPSPLSSLLPPSTEKKKTRDIEKQCKQEQKEGRGRWGEGEKKSKGNENWSNL